MGDTRWATLVPAPVRELPADLAAVIVLSLATIAAALLPVLSTTPLRIVLGLPFVLFLPGYAFVAALFPEAGESAVAASTADGDGGDLSADSRRGIDGIERVALSFGLSIAIVPLIGLVLNFTPFGIRLVPILVGVGGFAILAAGVAAIRRRELPAEERFRVPYRSWYVAGRSELLEPDSRTDAALNVLLVVSVLLAASSVAYAVAVPSQGESFTEFYLLTENESGELVADDYPTELTVGESESVVVGIGNHEHERTEYTVVSQLQAVDRSGPNGTVLSVIDSAELGQFGVTLDHNETYHEPFEFEPSMTGDRLRLQFLLYRGDPPPSPDSGSAYRETHLWVNVTGQPSTSS